jgi:transcriptional regulator with XRE-family HTH domain
MEVKQNRVLERRQALGVSAYQVARAARVRWQTLRDIELGRRLPRAKTLQRIEEALARLEADAGGA